MTIFLVVLIIFVFIIGALQQKNAISTKEIPDNEKGTFTYQVFRGETLIKEKFFINGILAHKKLFHSNGSLFSETSYFENGLVKNLTVFDIKKEPALSLISDSETNFTKYFYENNHIVKKEVFIDSNLSSCETFYESGALKSKAIYIDFYGTQTNYSENGEVIEEFEVFDEFRIEKLSDDKIRFVTYKDEESGKDTVVERDLVNGIYKLITTDFYDEVQLKDNEFDGIYKRYYLDENKNVTSVDDLYKFENGKFIEIYKIPDNDDSFTFDKFSNTLTLKEYDTYDNKEYLENLYYFKPIISRHGYLIEAYFDYIQTDKYFYPDGTLEEFASYNENSELTSRKFYDESNRLVSEYIISDSKNCIGKCIYYSENNENKHVTHFIDENFSNIALCYDKSGKLIDQTYTEYDDDEKEL